MAQPRHRNDELAAQRRAEVEQAQRDLTWANVLTALMCLAWAGAGIFLLMWSAVTVVMLFAPIDP